MKSVEIFKKILGKDFSKLDEDQLSWLISLVEDKDVSREDATESLKEYLLSALEKSDKEVSDISANIMDEIRPKAVLKKEEATKLKEAVNIFKVAKAHEEVYQQNLATFIGRTEVNVNKTIQAKQVDGIDTTLSQKELRDILKKEKKLIKKEKRDTAREKRFALQRDEILSKLSNKPIKLHSRGEVYGSGQKDIKLDNITMSLPSLELLTDTNIHFSYGRKYGLVGRNGIGKTTFLKHLASHAFKKGIPSHLQILHIEQEVASSSVSVLQTVLATDVERETLMEELDLIQKLEKGETITNEQEEEYGIRNLTVGEKSDRMLQIYQRLSEIDSDQAEPRVSQILAGLGFSPEAQKMPTSSFSGGWRMRISLAQALFIEPDILLLDEPTNHLDLHSVVWLEDYLNSWDKTLIVVSHDRDFLNNVTTDIVLMKDKKLTRFKGNYDQYEKTLMENMKAQTRAKESQEREIRHMKEFIEKNRVKASTAKMAQSRIKKLEKMEIISEITTDPHLVIRFPEPDFLEQSAIVMNDVSFGYSSEKLLFTGVNVTVDMKTRAALVGNNGVGKSTLLKVMFGELPPTGGLVKINPKARISKFTQHHMDLLEMDKTPVSFFAEKFPTATNQEIRKHLGGMGVTGNLALQPIYSLSGGQKSRVALAFVTWTKPHILLLDEPTNHLDMDTVDSLIVALSNFEGGVLIVSHDAHLISTACEQIWVCADKQVRQFEGDFDDYRNLLSKSNQLKVVY